MHTVALLEQAIQAARDAGYKIRQEWLGGLGGGGCEIKGQKWIFIDLTLDAAEQLALVRNVLREDSHFRKSA